MTDNHGHEPLRQRLRGLAERHPVPPTLVARVAALPTPAATATRTRPVRLKVLLGLAAAVLLALPLWRTTRRAPVNTVWEFNPRLLAESHHYWQAHAAAQPADGPRVDELARRLTRQVGYPVDPPDLDRLGARLLGCTTCRHSFAAGRPVAVFVMKRQGKDLSLFELRAKPDCVRRCRFRPAGAGAAEVATADDVQLALSAQGERYAVLASASLPAEELAQLAPFAVRYATDGRLVALPGGFAGFLNRP